MSGFFLSAGFLLLALCSFNFLPTALIQSLENQYQPITELPQQNITKIIVLGGGVRSNTTLPPNTQLKAASLSRLIEAVRLYYLYQQQHRHVTLILSGGRVFGSPSEAGVMENTALFLGVAPQDIQLEAGSRNTYEEATYLKKYVQNYPFILVTSAYHMPRAIALFKNLGLNPIAAPTQYLTDPNKQQPDYYLPSSDYLITMDIAVHEYLGTYWARLQRLL